MRKWIISFIILGLSFQAWADHRVGNGGDVVVCPTGYELLDFYEARSQRGEILDIRQQPNVDSKLKFVFARLAKISPLRAELYSNQYTQFMSEAVFLQGAKFVDIPDSDHIAFPKDCAVEQAVVQIENPLPGQKRYTINGDLWEKLDETTRAGLILHELVYREAIASGHTNSIAARYLTGFLSSEVMARTSQDEFIHLLRQLEFRRTDLQGVWILLKYRKHTAPLIKHADGNLQMAMLDPDEIFERDGAIYSVSEFSSWGQGADHIQGPIVHFHPNGKIHSWTCARRCGPFQVADKKIWVQGPTAIHESGRLKNTESLQESFVLHQVGNEILLPREQILSLQFSDSGLLEQVDLGRFENGIVWKFSEQEWIRCKFPGSSEKLTFFPDGRFQSCWVTEGQLNLEGHTSEHLNGFLSLLEKGTILQARFKKAFYLSSLGLQILEIRRTPQGLIEYLQLGQNAWFPLASSKKKKLFQTGDRLHFDDQGLVDRKCQNSLICYWDP